ncbi:hypothetical protein ElyMa_000229200, partial [Elysia marginata]
MPVQRSARQTGESTECENDSLTKKERRPCAVGFITKMFSHCRAGRVPVPGGGIMESNNSDQLKESEARVSSDRDVQDPEQSSEDDLYQYETQHFGFTPSSLINGMFNSVCDFYREALKAFAKACYDKDPDLMLEEDLTVARRAVSEKIDTDICTVFDALE